ncbi:uncharacterized protein LOC134835812 [Culicoides brevitarsis]|uniref:uncharacterized protein LOC134835812 n=1 Tax=Culicoides brevitarsis TaxID=469753 RepID=UPI00307C5A82
MLLNEFFIIITAQFVISNTMGYELMGDTIPVPCTYTSNHVVLSCNCNFAKQIMEMSPHNGSIHYLQISNCDTLILRPSIFAQILDLKWIRLFNIRNLELGEKSFHIKNEPIEIKFDNVYVKSVPSYAFIGQIEELHFNNCTIDEFREYAVSGIATRMSKISLKDTRVKIIKPQAFKKISVENVMIENTNFEADLPSKAFYNIEIIDTLTIQHTNFQSLYPGSVGISKVAIMRVWNNAFHVVEAEAFNVTVKTSFDMEHNNFTAIHKDALKNVVADNVITVWEKIHQPRFLFKNNSIENIAADWSISPSSNFNAKIVEIQIQQPKTCDFVFNAAENDFIKNISHEIFVRTVADPKNVLALSQFEAESCQNNSYVVYGIVGAVLIVIGLIVVVIFVVLYFHREKKKIIQARMVSPEPRTYRETQIVMQVETHNLMKTDF